MTRYPVIAIDGPGASGKSTLARALARRLKFHYLDTGAMYRAFAWRVLREKIGFKNEKKIVAFCKRQKIKVTKSKKTTRTLINGKDVTREIRTSEVSEAASILSRIRGVRKIMAENQRKLARKRKVVLEGRDIGTVVFPQADCKIFLDASSEERVRRRLKEFSDKGYKVNKAKVKRDLIRRDTRDTLRKIAPLRRAKDAVLLDSSDLTISQMVEEALKIITQKIKVNVL